MAVEDLSASILAGNISVRRTQTSVCVLITYESIDTGIFNATQFKVGQ